MMDDPLKRRMFAQPVRANQPMGILASSPQLMNTVQGYANGGAVKGYNLGGYEVGQNIPLNQIYGSNIPAPDFSGPLYKGIGGQRRKEQEIARIKQTELEKLIQSGFGDVGPTISIEDAKKSSRFFDIPEPNVNSKATKNNEQKVMVDDYPAKKKFPDEMEGGAAAVKINETNEKLTQTDKELKDNIPEGRNLGLKSGKDIVTEATNDYESWKTKFQEKKQEDKKFEASQDKVKDFTSKIETLMDKTDKPLSLDDAYKQAEKQLGVKEGRYDEDKMTAFWMAMIAGGAETAAGQSSNALTNFARGLKFGVQQYGKDLNAINEEEREDRKNVAKLSYELIKDDKNAKLAERTLKIQGFQALANLEEKKFQFRSEMEYKKERDNINNEMAFASLQLTAAKTFNDMALGKGDYDLKVETLALNKQKQKDYMNNFEKELNQKFQLGIMTPEIKNVIAFGKDFGSFDDQGRFTLADKGRQIILASVLGKTKVTDTIKTAQAFGKNKIVYGSEYATADEAESAYLVFKGEYEPRIKVLEKLSENSLKKIDREKYQQEVDSLKQEFFKATGAIRRIDGSSTGSISQNTVNLPSNLIEQLNSQNTKIGEKFKTPNGKQYKRTGENTAVLLE